MSCELRGHTGSITRIAFSRDGRRLVSVGDDQQVVVWDSSTGKRMLTLTEHTGRIRGVLFSVDVHKLLTSAEDGFLIVRDSLPWKASEPL